jgi:low affinity Fe/Cu permease
MHIKMDELIRVSRNGRNILLDLEELDDKDLEAIRQDYERLAEEGRSAAHKRSPRAAAKPKKASPKKRSDS